jgi:hypothetical protein
MSPSPYPLPRGEREKNLKLERNILPLDGGGVGGDEIGDFFTLSGGEGKGFVAEYPASSLSGFFPQVFKSFF